MEHKGLKFGVALLILLAASLIVYCMGVNKPIHKELKTIYVSDDTTITITKNELMGVNIMLVGN